MAGTRNKQTKGDFDAHENEITKQHVWLMMVPSHDRPSFPNGINNPRMPASNLSNNAVDIETMLRGIGSNNFTTYQKPVVPILVQLPQICFYETSPVYIPKLPPRLVGQRPF